MLIQFSSNDVQNFILHTTPKKSDITLYSIVFVSHEWMYVFGFPQNFRDIILHDQYFELHKKKANTKINVEERV